MKVIGNLAKNGKISDNWIVDFQIEGTGLLFLTVARKQAPDCHFAANSYTTAKKKYVRELFAGI